MKSILCYFAIIPLLVLKAINCLGENATPLNVILVMTDDQGYGDIAAHGNPFVETPNMDRMHDTSVRLENFHVNPTCSPTRAALMTGKYNHRVGVWHTVLGRERIRSSEMTMADIFSGNGYVTGIFGKWHLGDDYPFRPSDRGFQESVICKAGSVTQMPNYWDNDRMNDTYFRNDQPEEYKGYSADVFFDEAISFMEKNKDKPFFAYIPTSAPHGPRNVVQTWADKYLEKGLTENVANFYASIERLDYNLGKLIRFLNESGLEQSTMLVFLTDNGTASLNNHNSAGMRGNKGSPYEGGHRVPCFIYSPKNNLTGGKAYHDLTSVMDLFPTFIDMCNLKVTDHIEFDGQSLQPLLLGKRDSMANRYLVVENQRVPNPVKWKQCVVVYDKWRLINGKELYDMEADFGQKHDVSDEYPEIVSDLRMSYEKIWEDISAKDHEYHRLILGSSEEHETLLTAQDWYWKNNSDKQNLIVGQANVREGKLSNGIWPVEVEQAGHYVFELRRWPKETGLSLNASVKEIPSHENDIALKRFGKKPKGRILNITRAKLKINEIEKEVDVTPTDKSVEIKVKLDKGLVDVQTWFYTSQNEVLGAYYVYVKKI